MGAKSYEAKYVYFADSGNHRIRRINLATNILSNVAGTGFAGYSGDGGPATSAMLNTPYSVILDASGNVYISDTGNNCIRVITTSGGIILNFAGICLQPGVSYANIHLKKLKILIWYLIFYNAQIIIISIIILLYNTIKYMNVLFLTFLTTPMSFID